MSEFESELYPIDFEDPPGQLKNPTILTFWWTSREVRRVLSHSPWSERLRYHGETPFFCFHNGFCTYFETRKGLEGIVILGKPFPIVVFSQWRV